MFPNKMALNPPLVSATMPAAIPGEVFILRRPLIRFEASGGGLTSSIRGEGSLYMTSVRICIVFSTPVMVNGSMVRAFDVPLAYVSGEKFEQPIFGANHLRGRVRPIPGMGLSGEVEWKVYYVKGGAQAMLGLFFAAIRRLRERTSVGRSDWLRMVEVEGPRMASSDDPTVIYYGQPVEAFGEGEWEMRDDIPVAPVVTTTSTAPAPSAPPPPSSSPPSATTTPTEEDGRARGGGGGRDGGSAGFVL